MRRLVVCLSNPILILFLFCAPVVPAQQAAPAQRTAPTKPAPDVSEPEPESIAPGEITSRNYGLSTATLENKGVRVGQVTRRAQLPGGPWATGDIGDYILENEYICVIVRGKNRPPLTDSVPGAGQIVDIAFRDQMWDQFGGLAQLARIEGKQFAVRYNHIEIKSPARPELPPVLEAYGVLSEMKDVLVVTTIYVEPHAPSLLVSTQYWNDTKSDLTLHMMDGVGWGSLPIFVGGYGVPKYTKNMRLASHWICGFLDDFCVGIVNVGPDPMDIAPTVFNQSSLVYGAKTLKPKENTRILRSVILTKNDMAPIVRFALESKKIDYGWIQGKIVQESDGKPVAGEEVRITRVRQENDQSNPLPPYAITVSGETGEFKCPLPTGEYSITHRSVGRPLTPTRQIAVWSRKGEVTTKTFIQADINVFVFEAVDADTGESLPAKVRFMPLKGTAEADFGPPWKAQGARSVFYLKPGPNPIPLTKGDFQCVFSRGPEYDIVEKEVHLKFGQPQTIRAELKRVVPTPNLIAADFNLPTSVSPSSRVSPEDLVLAAAGEGLEWIFSGDLGRATDLNGAIRTLGLEKWIRASSGAHLSYQYPRLFGDFYVFPMPADTSAKKLAALAGPETSPAEFFQAVRKAFPDAVISVMSPSLMNASYLDFYGVDHVNGILPEGSDFSLDFDALEVFESKAAVPSLQAWGQMEFLMKKGSFKLPLASSRSASLYYEEPGYPRTYLVMETDDARAADERDVPKALRDGRYFITNGPIVEQSIGGKWPSRFLAPPNAKFVHELKISAAPWVKVSGYSVKKLGEGSLFLGQMRPKETIVRFWTKDQDQPWEWQLYNLDPETKELKYRDAAMHVQVDGLRLSPVVTGKAEEGYQVFAITPPVLMDATGDGKVELR